MSERVTAEELKDEPFAYFHRIKEPGISAVTLLSRSPDNPWSHWVRAHRDSCEYSVTPLYSADTIAALDAEIASLRELVKELRDSNIAAADWMDRLDSAIERAENDIGGESIATVLKELGPTEARLRALIAKADKALGDE